MFKNIVIIADNSAQMTELSNYISDMFPNAFFNIVSIINLGAFSNYYAKIAYKEMKELSDKTVSEMEKVFIDKKINYSTQTLMGDPAFEALSFAKSKDADLIVIDTHSGITTNKIKVGKTTASLITHSHVPILLLSEYIRSVSVPKILHPTTGSKYSEMATEIAVEFAKYKKSSLDVLFLRPDPKTHEKTKEIIGKEKVKASYSIAEGNEINAIISKSLDADLIIGSRGSPRPTYKLRFLVHSFALDPTVKLLVAFLPKPFLLVCD